MMDKKDFLKESWQAVNAMDWKHGAATMEENLRARAYLEDRPLNVYEKLARSAYDNAIKRQKRPESDQLAPIIAEYQAKANEAESAYKTIIEKADKVPEIAIILAKMADIDTRRAACLDTMDAANPSYMMDSLAVNWYAAKVKTELAKELEAKTKEAALASMEANKQFVAMRQAQSVVSMLTNKRSGGPSGNYFGLIQGFSR